MADAFPPMTFELTPQQEWNDIAADFSTFADLSGLTVAQEAHLMRLVSCLEDVAHKSSNLLRWTAIVSPETKDAQ